jgi:hypothetical protein
VSSLDGARAKVDRAGEHLKTLDAETTAFMSRHPYRLTRKYYAKTCHVTFRFAEDEEPAVLRWGVLIGDVLHEVSSALDHVAWQFALKTKPKPTSSTAWPVCVGPGDWESKRTKAMLQHISAADRAFINSKQPYPAPHGMGPETHAFAMLRLLSRIDKHRVLHTSVLLPLDIDIKFIPKDCTVRDAKLIGEPLKQGAKFVRVFVDPTGPDPDVDMKLDLSMYVGFSGPEYGHMDRGAVFLALHIFIKEVGNLIDEAEACL